MTAIRPLVAGNWKMNGLKASISEAEALAAKIKASAGIEADAMVCPPATLVAQFAQALPALGIAVGAQDCHANVSGAHTGDIAAEMLADAGASAIIVGHSERRTDHGETDDVVLAKAQAVHRVGLMAIICVGETIEQREAGKTLDIVGTQLSGSIPQGVTAADTVIAYEPVWAIGTGLTPTVEDVAEVHGFIRERLADIAAAGEGSGIRIQYGGSVKPDNAAELMGVANVNGALVGGASLKADDFFGILSAYAAN